MQRYLTILFTAALLFTFRVQAQCVNDACSNDNPLTGPIIVGDEVLRAPYAPQAITRFELLRGPDVCAVQPYREVYNQRGHRWTQPWFQPYASTCWPLYGWTSVYTIRACRSDLCSTTPSNPVEVKGQVFCCFDSTHEVPCEPTRPLCFGGRL